jgi:hypothetical protein
MRRGESRPEITSSCRNEQVIAITLPVRDGPQTPVSLSRAMRHRVQPVACRGSAPSDISATACRRYAMPAYRH